MRYDSRATYGSSTSNSMLFLCTFLWTRTPRLSPVIDTGCQREPGIRGIYSDFIYFNLALVSTDFLTQQTACMKYITTKSRHSSQGHFQFSNTERTCKSCQFMQRKNLWGELARQTLDGNSGLKSMCIIGTTGCIRLTSHILESST